MRRRDNILSPGGNGTGGVISRLQYGKRDTLFRLTVLPEEGPQTITATIDVELTSGASFAARNDLDLRANVSWGNGRGGGDALIDVCRSTVFTVTAAWNLTVEIDYPTSPTIALPAGPDVRVEGGAVFGTLAAVPARRTAKLGRANPTQTIPATRVRVPKYAQSALVMFTASNAQGVLNFYQDNGAGPLLYTVPVDPTILSPFPIANSAEFFDFTNQGPATDVVVVFGLVL
jgi:hypothetical protein